ncbi:tyrosine-type recombinase/integrase [Simplicispira metamorpha]|uniref:Site-specific recombinase XerD n=1 Tax=Simplicispira metamorpha TaxID=80881 RepID=A0A4R2NDG6_9BURK|nr:integrase family protein [Simplicispira metamorpha]TCP19105.1 site-specific recombinase XerD [Simplicispira metamorpha]
MARPSKTAAIDYSAAHDLTHGLLERATCPPERPFVLVKDADKKGLRLRVTKAGGKHWQFETRIKGNLFTRALGEWPAVSIGDARAEAHRLRGLTEAGTDPREIERQQQTEHDAAQAAAAAAQALAEREATAQALTVGEVWATYIKERTPHWGELHRKDHERLARAGGETARRGTRGRGLTIAGPLHPLMALALRDLTPATIEAWAAREAQTRPTAARLAWRLLKAFLGWCAEQPHLATIVSGTNPAKTKKTREALGKPRAKDDSLLKEQLPAWFAAVRSIGSATVSAYLQTLLLTGARPGEVLAMRWEDLNTQWRGLTIRDKVEGARVIPLTPYVWHLLASLPRRNEYVFASTSAKSGVMTEPNHANDKACTVAGIERLTLHGLRRSFGSLAEWLEIPAGVVAQIQGHKPSATAEKHYRVRPLDLLRLHHERIEAWMLEQAGVQFTSASEPGTLRLVAGGAGAE